MAWMGVDIGRKTIDMFVNEIKSAGAVIWNGPMGVFENEAFAKGTRQLGLAVAECKGRTIIGGGDSAAAIIQMGLKDRVTHISTGGGASLKLFEGATLPAVEVIENR